MKFPKTMYITKDKDGEEEYFTAWEEIPESDNYYVAEYKLVRVGKITVSDPTVAWKV